MSYRTYSFIAMMWLLLVDGVIIRNFLDRGSLYVFRIVMVLLISVGSSYYIAQKWKDETATKDPLWKMITGLFLCLFWGVMVFLRYF